MTLRVALSVLFLLLPEGVRGAQAQTLNLSTDLAPIAGANMLPNMPRQDSAPLLNKALQYVAAHPGSYTRLIADPGDYYFLTATESERGNSVYVAVQNLTGVTLDFHGANLLFTQPAYSAFYISNCTGCFFRDFTIDYTTLPFTQLTVTEVHTKAQRIVGVLQPYLVSTLSYQNPHRLFCTQSQLVPPPYFGWGGFNTRNGVPQTVFGRWNVSPPANGCGSGTETGAEAAGQVTLELNDDVSSIQAGDVFVVSARGGGPAVWIEASTGATFQSVSIYTSGGPGIIASNPIQVSFLGVAVVPRPGTNRLASTMAGGIQLPGLGANNRVQNSTVIGTQDDSIAGNATALGAASATVPSGNTVTYAPPKGVKQPIPSGTVLFFAAQVTGLPVGQGPLGTPFTVQSSSVNGATFSITITPTPTPGEASSIANASLFNTVRGNGLTVTNNLVQNSFFARGIAFQGISGAVIGYNTILCTQEAGIAVDNSLADGFGPNYDVLIEHNLVAGANGGLAGIGSEMLGAIQALSLNGVSNGDWSQTSPSHRILINDNQIVGTLRTGIWVGNVATGVVSNNKLVNTSLNPAIAPGSHLPTGMSSDFAEQSFTQPVFTTAGGVLQTNNSTAQSAQAGPCR